MAVYVVTWNLNKERSNYAQARRAFLEMLEKYPGVADPGLESVRFISADQSADHVSAFLRQRPDDDDRLLASRMNKGENQGWLSKSVWDWINARL